MPAARVEHPRPSGGVKLSLALANGNSIETWISRSALKIKGAEVKS